MNQSKSKFVFLLLIMLLAASCGPSLEERRIKEGEELEAQGQHEQALAKYWQAYQENPRGAFAARALFSMGNLDYYYLKNPVKALEYFELILKDFPRSPEAARAQPVVAEIYDEALGDYARAALEYKKVLALQKGGKEGLDRYQFRLARCYFKAGAFEDAIKAFQDLILQYPASDLVMESRYQIAQTYYIKGDFAQALANFEKLSRLNLSEPLKSDVLMGLASAHEEQGDLDQSEAIYQKIETTYHNPALVKDRLKRIAALKIVQKRVDKGRRRK